MMLFVDNTAVTCSSHLQLLKKRKIVKKREAKAKAVCSGCPVKFECLEEANEISEPFGGLGGLNEVERKREAIYT